MSRDELVAAYVEGRVSRRTFIRRMVALGMSASAAVAYATTLGTERAVAANPPDYYLPAAVTLLPATAVTTGGAVLNGSVDPNYRQTTCWFEYGPTTSYGLRTPDQNAGAVGAPQGPDFAASATIDGLAPNTTYHYRLLARSDHSPTPVATPDGTFTTLPDTRKPAIAVALLGVTRGTVFVRRRIRVRVTADEAVTGSVKVVGIIPATRNTPARRLTLGTARFRTQGPGSTTVTVSLSRLLLTRLRLLMRTRLRIEVSAADRAGNRTSRVITKVV